jgi:hypothetical protein
MAVSIPQWCDCCCKSCPASCFSDCEWYLCRRGSFNPTMVRLLPAVMSLPNKFQSHNGAIAHPHLSERNEMNTNVSIPQWCDCCLLGHLQFKFRCDCCEEWKRRLEFMFQSHNGAIAALRSSPQSEGFVSIPQWCDANKDRIKKGFNPTMVRLLPMCTINEMPCRSNRRFNPTMVRLLPNENFRISSPYSFNPTMVRLLQFLF